MARHGLVHAIVHDFGKEVVQGLFIGAADIHAGAAADGLQPLQHLDVGGGILLLAPWFWPRLWLIGFVAVGKLPKRSSVLLALAIHIVPESFPPIWRSGHAKLKRGTVELP